MISSPLFNLVVDLTEPFPSEPLPGIKISPPGPADGRTLAWIDEAFGGAWSSEAAVGANVVARRDGVPIGFATLDARALRFAWLSGLAREPGVGIFGPFGVAAAERGRGLGLALLRRALGALRERGYARALVPAVGDERLIRYYAGCVGARIAERFDRAALCRVSRRTLVMASGNGSNFQAVLDASRDGSLPLQIVGLLCNEAQAHAVERARNGDVAAQVVAWNRGDETRAQYDRRLLAAATGMQPDLILLLGWMHLLTDSFVGAFPELLNLHPAFLPLDPRRDDVVMPDGTLIRAFRGPRAVRDALAASCQWVGATLHR
ncbi:MAG: GNAT family N-acetyltransferase, partial [Candidatus Eremiobacteraeota bacterium]|nr:GNAT family N-acetyltransferase [Candidatus Eremiobacteraeota bacterium]